MTVEDALARYETAREHMAGQHRYIGQAQDEVASRSAILPNLEAEVLWSKACLDSAEGRQVDWESVRERVKDLRAQTEAAVDLYGYRRKWVRE